MVAGLAVVEDILGLDSKGTGLMSDADLAKAGLAQEDGITTHDGLLMESTEKGKRKKHHHY